jgi:hypothetical protein
MAWRAAAAGIALLACSASAVEKPTFGGGVMMGYTLGQNGAGWPQPWKDPLRNDNRGGFYISQVRANAGLAVDSSFRGRLSMNLANSELLEAFLEKDFGDWRFKAGRFRGAGLRSAVSEDEFSQDLVNRPRYARLWNHYKKLISFRDFGIQAERTWFSGRFENRFFLHNANRENVYNDEPSFPVGQTTQVLGFDYGWDLKVSPYSAIGGHVGALADRQWDEFIGAHEAWEVQYWFKSNPIVDGSINHRMDFPRFHLENECLAMLNRNMRSAVDSSAMLTWGASTLARFDAWHRWSPFLGYEFTDHSDGYFRDDALHMFKFGTVFRPSPERYAGLKVTAQYVRSYEEALRNNVGNDLLYAQLQMVF